MEAKIKAKASDLFKNQYAKDYYNLLIKNSDIYEYGLDQKGLVYFAYLNGNIERYTKREFIRESKAYFENCYYVHFSIK